MARLTGTDEAGRVCTPFSEFLTLKKTAVSAARQALGKSAQPGADFRLEQTTEGWTWLATVDSSREPALKPAAYRPASPPPPSGVQGMFAALSAAFGRA